MSSEGRGSRTICRRPSISSLGWRSKAVGSPKGAKNVSPGVDVLLANSDEYRVIVGIAADLVAALGPHVDGVDPRKREWPPPNCGMT